MYAIRLRHTGSKVVIAAPHAGAIEPGASEIALALAGDDLSYYLFEGRKPKANGELHITSSNFDEPQCLELLATATIVVTVHGQPSRFLGGTQHRNYGSHEELAHQRGLLRRPPFQLQASGS